MKTVEIRITAKNNFAKAVSYAKRAGGRFNPATKTWSIPAERPELNGPSLYGWQIVKQAEPTEASYAATHYVGQASMDHEDSIF